MGLNELGAVVAVTAALGQSTFVAFYATFRWWRTTLGRLLFIKAGILAVFTILLAFSQVFDWTHEKSMMTTAYAFVAAAMWAQLIAFYLVRKEVTRESR